MSLCVLIVTVSLTKSHHHAQFPIHLLTNININTNINITPPSYFLTSCLCSEIFMKIYRSGYNYCEGCPKTYV